MSLVAYGSSDESSEDEEVSEKVENVENLIEKTRSSLSLPAPKDVAVDSNLQTRAESSKPTLFQNLPKPKHIEISPADEAEDDVMLPRKDSKTLQDKMPRKNRAPVKISLPSLSEFKDVDEEQEERRKNRIKPSEKGTGLFAILPPPKGSSTKATIKSLIPDVVKRVSQPSRTVVPRQVRNEPSKTTNPLTKTNSLGSINYDSDSDDENSSTGNTKQKIEGKTDYFSLDSGGKVSPGIENSSEVFFSLSEEPRTSSAKSSTSKNTLDMLEKTKPENVTQVFKISDQPAGNESKTIRFDTTMECGEKQEMMVISDKTLTSNVINLPREEIILKNKAEVGPKLPVPEQEYNVDSQGNVAFDEKAIEYLCGKRGVKRKNKDFDEVNIIEINGEDIKPDEREWLVKALTEEPAERPVSMESAGPSTQSRKKHQITYLAHQAKAMEVELKNQWAQNRVTRKQTQSKYGF